MINLPYIVDGDKVVTQSNSCLTYLGSKLGIDKPELAADNHMVLDQTMDLRNDTMKICYGPAGKEFKPALEGHMQGAVGHLSKLEGFCKGPYMCGNAIQSGDFHVFEMLDQHIGMCSETGVEFPAAMFPKLVALHAKVKSDPALAAYFKADMYAKYAYNNAMYANFVGSGYGNGPFGNTTKEVITMVGAAPVAGGKKEKAAKGLAQQAKQTPEEKAAKEAAKAKEKVLKTVIKEGGKKGVEIEGASDMGGLDFFCTVCPPPLSQLADGPARASVSPPPCSPLAPLPLAPRTPHPFTAHLFTLHPCHYPAPCTPHAPSHPPHPSHPPSHVRADDRVAGWRPGAAATRDDGDERAAQSRRRGAQGLLGPRRQDDLLRGRGAARHRRLCAEAGVKQVGGEGGRHRVDRCRVQSRRRRGHDAQGAS